MISIHALLAESDIRTYQRYFAADISIHALLAESDHYGWSWYDDFTISIHALLAESDSRISRLPRYATVFLSTLSLRRATLSLTIFPASCGNFYPRSPCGERLWPGLLARPFFLISIHALLAESDKLILIISPHSATFLSTLSLRRATREPTALRTPHHIFLSTLSLRRATDRV